MAVDELLKTLTKPEKIELLEALWEDLSENREDIESPEWHRQVLEERLRKIESGEEKFIDLNELEQRVRQRISSACG